MVKFRCTKEKINSYLSKLRITLEKVDDANEGSIKINKIVSYIRKLLNNERRFETNQEMLGMRNVFRGIVIKSWTGNDFDASNDRKFNKIIVKKSVLFYTEF